LESRAVRLSRTLTLTLSRRERGSSPQLPLRRERGPDVPSVD
jgi:hypothetical protein